MILQFYEWQKSSELSPKFLIAENKLLSEEELHEEILDMLPWLTPIKMFFKKLHHDEQQALLLYAQMLKQGKPEHEAIHIAASSLGYRDKQFADIVKGLKTKSFKNRP